MVNINDIKDPSFLDSLSIDELNELSNEIRSFIIEKVSITGGHLSSNLGIVDLVIALNRYFKDTRFIYDVGHQCYTQKILTGRASMFDSLRQKDGLRGFPSAKEDPNDFWENGHSSTSIAAQMGCILNGVKAISIIGDGALASGEALESLEQISTLRKKAIIILNDNDFSISKPVGALKNVLDKLRGSEFYNKLRDKNINKKSFINLKNFFKSIFKRDNIFTSLGLRYFGPIDGHNYKELFKYFEYAEKCSTPVLLHVVTKKGKGYKYAEEDKLGLWHMTGPFDIETGKPKTSELVQYSAVVSSLLEEEYKKNKNLYVINPAMIASSSMNNLKDIMGDHFIDAGIMEDFSLSLSSSLALTGSSVYVHVFSSFLQRAYDQILCDISLQNSPVVLGVDKCGIVPGNGRTHQGIYNVSYLLSIPNILIAYPSNSKEIRGMLEYAFSIKKPIALCYSSSLLKDEEGSIKIDCDKWNVINNISKPKAVIITYGALVDYIKEEALKNNIEVINARFIRPLDSDALIKASKLAKNIYIYEEQTPSLYKEVCAFYNLNNINVKVHNLSLPNEYIEQGSIEETRKTYALDKDSVLERIKNEA